MSRATMRFIEVNAIASHMLGYSREELLELGPTEVSAGSRGQLELLYDTIIESRQLTESTEVARRKDGSTLTVEVHRRAAPAESDWIIVGTLRDLTELTEAHTSLPSSANTRLLTSSRFAHLKPLSGHQNVRWSGLN